MLQWPILYCRLSHEGSAINAIGVGICRLIMVGISTDLGECLGRDCSNPAAAMSHTLAKLSTSLHLGQSKSETLFSQIV